MIGLKRQFLLAIDVGNSRYKFGLFPDEAAARRNARSKKATNLSLPACTASTALPANQPIPWDRLIAWSESCDGECTSIVIAGANPCGIDQLLSNWPASVWPQPRIVNSPQMLLLRINLPAPEKVGIDRLLGAVAANLLRQEGQPVIVVDTGTATTVDYLSGEGVFEGGAILPGFQLCAASLHDYTALLPLIPVSELAGQAPAALGRNTRDAIRSGLFWGQLGAVRELITQLAAQAGRPPLLLLTGGGAPLLAPHFEPEARLEPHLPLRALALVADLNSHSH